jgi:low affinity Fe/Cu permease
MRLEEVERQAAQPWFLVAFNVVIGAAFVVAGVDIANILISIVTADLVLLGLGAARRSQLALHAKLDELIAATEGARDDLAHVEDMAEAEIQEKRL